MKIQILKAALLLLVTATTIAAQKKGNVTIQANQPIKVTITSAGPGWSISLHDTTPITETLPVGDYVVRFEVPDGVTTERAITVRKNCTTRLDVTYKPSACPNCAPVTLATVPDTPVVVDTPKPEPAFEFKPQPVPTLFDTCCNCSRDDLKARLDLFAIQLHQNPTAQGRIIAPTLNTDALLYLIHQRGVDHKRVELRVDEVNCVELWIVP